MTRALVNTIDPDRDRVTAGARPVVGLLVTVVVAGALLAAAPGSAADYPPTAGTDRESDAYFDAVETSLRNLDLNDPDLVFERLGGTTATNWAVTKDGQIVADLKCTSGNTDHHGAVIAYRLGRELGFNIYPVAVYRDVDREIDGRRFAEQCALKEWSSVFTQYYWTRDTFTDTDSRDKRNVIDALHCDGPKPTADDAFWYHARSAYGDPKLPGARRVIYDGATSLLEAARDFSSMMVVDTLIGNEDRFPGGNTFFRSVTTSYQTEGDRVVFDDVRLFSLDNEAAFKGRTPDATHSAKDLKAHVSRFDAHLLAGIERLAADPTRLERITDGNEHLTTFIRGGIEIVLEQAERAAARCGTDAATF